MEGPSGFGGRMPRGEGLAKKKGCGTRHEAEKSRSTAMQEKLRETMRAHKEEKRARALDAKGWALMRRNMIGEEDGSGKRVSVAGKHSGLTLHEPPQPKTQQRDRRRENGL